MAEKIKLTIITLTAYFLQLTFLRFFDAWGIVPNIMVVFCICYALWENEVVNAAIYGVLCGVLLDFSAETIFGLNALLALAAAVFCSLAGKKFFGRKFLVSMLFVLLVSILYEVLYYVMSFANHEVVSVWKNTFAIALPTSVYNAFLSVFILPIMKRLTPEKEE